MSYIKVTTVVEESTYKSVNSSGEIDSGEVTKGVLLNKDLIELVVEEGEYRVLYLKPYSGSNEPSAMVVKDSMDTLIFKLEG